MRIGLWVAVVLSSASSLRAQDLIEWSTERPLSMQDFKGRPPADSSRASLSWLNIDVSWQCEGHTLVADVRATFDPGRSWWRPAEDGWQAANQRDRRLLEHEQLHFDLAEIAARKLRKRFEDLEDACADPAAQAELQPVVAEIDRELQEEQRRYDRETDHGTNHVAQEGWRRTIRRRLGLPSR